MPVAPRYQMDAYDVARLLLDMRLHASLTPDDLGELLGLSEATVRRMERGDGHPCPGQIVAWADACGFRLEIVTAEVGR